MNAYPYLRGDGVPVASPLFQGEGGGSTPTSPLQLHFREIDVETACQLNALWHSRLPKITPFNARCGLYHVAYVAEMDGAYYATAIWSGAVARLLYANDLLELRRMAIAPEAPTNTATRMLGWMIRDIRKRWLHMSRLVSYQDTAVHNGTIYAASNWEAVSTSAGDEWTRPCRYRKPTQTDAPKVRWEYRLRQSAPSAKENEAIQRPDTEVRNLFEDAHALEFTE